MWRLGYNMAGFVKKDIESWARKEHYLYYTEKLKIEFNLTANIEVEELLDVCHTYGYRFYPAIIYFVTRVLNGTENFRMFRDQAGDLCVWDKIVPNYTIFHKDDCTFSDCWTDYSEDFQVFYQHITQDMQICSDKKGIKAKPGQPANFYCISCAPWTAFTGYGSRVAGGEPAFFPIVTIGKYGASGDHMLMPVNLMVAHAVADGYHAGLFFQNLQDELRTQHLLDVMQNGDRH